MLQSPLCSVLSTCKWTIARAAFPRSIQGRSVVFSGKCYGSLGPTRRLGGGSSGELAPCSVSWIMMKDCLGVKRGGYVGPEGRFQHCLLCKGCRCTDECFSSKRTSPKHPHKAAGTTVQIQYLTGRVQKMLGSRERLGW